MNSVVRSFLMFLVVPVLTVTAMYSAANLGWMWLLALAPAGLVVAMVVAHGFRLPEDYLKRWTKSHGIVITDENRDVIYRYLRRGRRIRTSGAVIGYVSYTIWVIVVAGDNVDVGWLRATFGGYLLGAAVAELWAFRPQRSGPRTAALLPRRITTYVPRYAIALMRIIPLLIVGLVAVWQQIPRGPSPFPDVEFADRIPSVARPDFGEALAWLGIAFVLLILVEATARRIVHRPQSLSSEALVEADDAIRSTAMHGLVGAGLTLELGILSTLASRWTSFVGGGSWNALLSIVTLVAGFGAMFAWLRLGIDQPWIVRRAQRRQEAIA